MRNNYIMRSNNIFTVDTDEILSTLFWDYVKDHNIDLGGRYDESKIRCAIVGCALDVQRSLMERFNVDMEEGE